MIKFRTLYRRCWPPSSGELRLLSSKPPGWVVNTTSGARVISRAPREAGRYRQICVWPTRGWSARWQPWNKSKMDRGLCHGSSFLQNDCWYAPMPLWSTDAPGQEACEICPNRPCPAQEEYLCVQGTWISVHVWPLSKVSLLRRTAHWCMVTAWKFSFREPSVSKPAPFCTHTTCRGPLTRQRARVKPLACPGFHGGIWSQSEQRRLLWLSRSAGRGERPLRRSRMSWRWLLPRVHVCVGRCVPDRWRRLRIASGVKPDTVVFSVAGEDLVNAKWHWTAHRLKTPQGCRQRRTREAPGYQEEDALRSSGIVLLVDFPLAAGGGLASQWSCGTHAVDCIWPCGWFGWWGLFSLDHDSQSRPMHLAVAVDDAAAAEMDTVVATLSSFFESTDVTPGVPPGGEEAPVLQHSAAPCTSSLWCVSTDSCDRNGWPKRSSLTWANPHTIERANVTGTQKEGATDGNQKKTRTAKKRNTQEKTSCVEVTLGTKCEL